MIKLEVGDAGLIRRPAKSSARERTSYKGSYPRKESLNPFLPACAPWHVP